MAFDHVESFAAWIGSRCAPLFLSLSGIRQNVGLRIFIVFVSTRLLIGGVGGLAMTYLPAITGPEFRHLTTNPVLDMWYRWDAGFYLAIARYNYGWQVTHALTPDTVFMPLYPFSIRALDHLVGCSTLDCTATTGWLLSNVALLCATYLLFSFTKDMAGEKAAWRAVWLLMLVPGNIFLAGLYAEGLFFCLSAAVFVLLRYDHFYLAAAVAGLAALTRPVGIALYGLLLVYAWQKTRWKSKKMFVVAHSPLLTFGAYLGSVALVTGDPWGYFTAYQQIWGRAVATSPLQTLLAYFSGAPVALWGWQLSWMDLAFALFYLTLAILVVRQDRLLGIFSLLAILIPMNSGNLTGMPRYGMVVLPFYVFIARWADVRWKQVIVYGLSFFLLVLFTARFALWRWLA